MDLDTTVERADACRKVSNDVFFSRIEPKEGEVGDLVRLGTRIWGGVCIVTI